MDSCSLKVFKYIWKNYNSFLLKQENQKNWIKFQEIQSKKKFEYQSLKSNETSIEKNQQKKDDNLISVRNLTKSYIHKGKKINVFKDISFDYIWCNARVITEAYIRFVFFV